MKGIDDIKQNAHSLGACALLDNVDSFKDAVRLLTTPQGREFACRTGYPSLDTWRENESDVKDLVFLDSGDVTVCGDCIAVGSTNVDVIAVGTEKLTHIIIMHGARLSLTACRYAVVTITNVCGEIEQIDNDGTARIYIEEKQ